MPLNESPSEKQVKHTPLPFVVTHDARGWPLVMDAEREMVADIFGSMDEPAIGKKAERAEANADFIARACNSHEDLKDALRSLLPLVEPATAVDVNAFGEIYRAAREALAKAGG